MTGRKGRAHLLNEATRRDIGKFARNALDRSGFRPCLDGSGTISPTVSATSPKNIAPAKMGQLYSTVETVPE